MGLRASFHRRMAEIAAAEWDALDRGGVPFLRHAFLDAAERHGAVSRELGWQPHHLALRERGGRLVAAAPCYVRSHSFGDFSRDWNWAPAWERAGLRYYPKLVCGIPYTPATGPRLLVAPDAERDCLRRALLEAMLGEARRLDASSLQCLHLDEKDDALRALLAEHGFLLRRGLQFQWRNRGYRDFEDFLAGFSSEKRKKVKRERRRVAESGLRLEVRHGNELDEALWRAVHSHYRSTFVRYGNHPAFPRAFFADVGKTLGRELVLFLAWEGARLAAAAVCYRGADTLYGRHWGAAAEYPDLHFELCYYQGIDYCIREGLACFDPGAGGEHKVSRGFAAGATWSAFWIADAAVGRLLARYLEQEAQAMAAYEEELRAHEPYRCTGAPPPGAAAPRRVPVSPLPGKDDGEKRA